MTNMCPNENKSVLCCAGKICVQYMKKTCAIQGQICAPEQTRPSKSNLSHHARRKCTRTTEEMRINKIILAMRITIVPMGVIKAFEFAICGAGSFHVFIQVPFTDESLIARVTFKKGETQKS